MTSVVTGVCSATAEPLFRIALVPTQAIEFVQMQRDDELWELLISLALSDADMTGALLPPSLQCSYVVPSTCILRSSVVRKLHGMK